MGLGFLGGSCLVSCSMGLEWSMVWWRVAANCCHLPSYCWLCGPVQIGLGVLGVFAGWELYEGRALFDGLGFAYLSAFWGVGL